MNRCTVCGRFVGQKGERFEDMLCRINAQRALFWFKKSYEDLVCPNGQHDEFYSEIDFYLQDPPGYFNQETSG